MKKSFLHGNQYFGFGTEIFLSKLILKMEMSKIQECYSIKTESYGDKAIEEYADNYGDKNL